MSNKWIFGVMSQKWSLEAPDMFTAYMAMALFIGQNVPVAVYSPQTYGFMPKDILEKHEQFDPKKVREALKTVKEEAL